MLDMKTSGKGTYAANSLIHSMNGRRDKGHYMGMATVWADVNGEVVVDGVAIEVGLTFDGTNFTTILIYWEEFGFKNYRKLGLYGKMSTQYQQVTFSPPRGLEISNDTGVVRFQYDFQ